MKVQKRSLPNACELLILRIWSGVACMTTDIDPGQLILRVSLTLVSAVAIGIERETTSRPAGLRTTLLVSLAACVAMIRWKLFSSAGKDTRFLYCHGFDALAARNPFRMGFIGAGAILRKNNLMVGVTTAATLWFVTVMGCCFGGGQLVLESSAQFWELLSFGVCAGSRIAGNTIKSDTLRLVAGKDGLGEEQIAHILNSRWLPDWFWSDSSIQRTQSASCKRLATSIGVRTSLKITNSFPSSIALRKCRKFFELEWSRESNAKTRLDFLSIAMGQLGSMRVRKSLIVSANTAITSQKTCASRQPNEVTITAHIRRK